MLSCSLLDPDHCVHRRRRRRRASLTWTTSGSSTRPWQTQSRSVPRCCAQPRPSGATTRSTARAGTPCWPRGRRRRTRSAWSATRAPWWCRPAQGTRTSSPCASPASARALPRRRSRRGGHRLARRVAHPAVRALGPSHGARCREPAFK